MIEVFVKYNPYKLETHITIGGQPLRENSVFNMGEERLQSWVENLPQMLVDECNSKEYKIVFHGTTLDYEDLLSVAEEARNKSIIINCEHIKAKEVEDKEQAIAELFDEIKNGPFEDLRQNDVIKAFESAKSSVVEVNVIATMSAGKSTLINALLSKKFMPSKQAACTATITKIKDTFSENFTATVLDKNSRVIETHSELSLGIMNEVNNNPNVSLIEVEGDIPFVTPEDVTLVLVDTPGPNNSRDPEHRAATYRMLSESSKTLILYVLNATQLEVEDDSKLLDYVSKSMSVGGKQSKDRFMFIVNKLDDFRNGEDSVDSSIDRVKKYLEGKGISKPNIFPAAALPALDIRTLQKNKNMDELLRDEIELSVKKLNRIEMLHLEEHAPLPQGAKDEIKAKLAKARESNDKYTEALIHTGIVPLELAIRMYVQKYAKTAKIKNIIDTFSYKLKSSKSFEDTKKQIADNQSKHEEIQGQIEMIKAKLQSGDNVEEFKAKIKSINYDKEISDTARIVIEKAQKDVSTRLSNLMIDNRKLSPSEARDMLQELRKFCEQLEAKAIVKLERILSDYIEKNAIELLCQYKEKINTLSNEINVGTVNISPIELMRGDISSVFDVDSIVSSITYTERVKVGEKWVKNTNKRWWKPLTWFDEKGHFEDTYEEKENVEGDMLAQYTFDPFQKSLHENYHRALEHTKKQSEQIKQSFYMKFDELDVVLNRKLAELEECTSSSRNVEEILKQTQENLNWLEGIQSKVEKILEI